MAKRTVLNSDLLDLGARLVENLPADISIEVAKEWTDDPEALQQFLGALRDGPPLGPIKTRELEVTIYPKRTVEEWVASGDYYFANPDFTTANFGRFLTVSGTEPYLAKVVAFNLGYPATIAKAKRIRTRLNLGPVGWEHVAAVGRYGRQHQAAQSEMGWIVDPDNVWVDPEQFHLITLIHHNNGRRRLSFNDPARTWCALTWFLGIAKSEQP